jgi:hypothetical protein
MNNPTIVVVAYNRLDSLQRLCRSLERMKAPEGEVRLLISIDNNGGKNKDVIDYANEYRWEFGPKEVRVKEKNTGLKAHIISCGDLTEEFGEVIILEDDLFVSPYFFDYVKKAHEFYKNDEKIAGISLYNYRLTDIIGNNKLPFIALSNHSDVYFMQIASSWGQSWSRQQWKGFKDWYNTDPELSKIAGLPYEVYKWPDSSWKKCFIAYLALTDKYFVYPTKSLSTNFNDPGTHYLDRDHDAQSPLATENPEIRFAKFSEAQNIYDAYFEITPETIKAYNSELKAYNFEVDLYGTKRPQTISRPYVITTKKCVNPILSFERSLKPHELNLFYSIPGNDIFLCKTSDLLQDTYLNSDLLRDFAYFYRQIFNRRELTMFIKQVIKAKWVRMLKK